ncbi:MAG: ATP-binding cassette domain-containing protein [Bacilli bacterium]
MLSRGQARKLMIVRLLAERPILLLLDEPINHVVFLFRGAVWTLLDGVLTPPTTTNVTQEDAMRMRAEIAELSQYSPPNA